MGRAGVLPRGGGGPRRRCVRHPEDVQEDGAEVRALGGGPMRRTLPNILTLARICLTPVIALLPFIQGYWPKVIAFLIFLVAAFSDVIDGWLARRSNMVSELGQLLDPIGDKLLLFATLIPIFWLTRHPTILVDYRIPWWGSLPVWVALLLVGRELLMTAFRFFAKRRGVVIPAMGAGKLKAVVQNAFIGATLFWFAWKDALAAHRWAGWFRNFWNEFHGAVVAVTLAGAILLTVYSLVVYLYRYRALLKGRGGNSKSSPSARSSCPVIPWIATPPGWGPPCPRRARGSPPPHRTPPGPAPPPRRVPAVRRTRHGRGGRAAGGRGVARRAPPGRLRVGPRRADRADRSGDRPAHAGLFALDRRCRPAPDRLEPRAG